MASPSKARAVFVTVGQAPRDDLVPEMRAWIGPGLEIVERGVLDELGPDAIAALAPAPGAPRLVTRLRDGRSVVVDKARIAERLRSVLERCDRDGADLIVLLCTGRFEDLRTRTLLVEAQSIVDHAVAALGRHARTLGVLIPLAEQAADLSLRPVAPGQELVVAAASPYEPSDEAAAAARLAACDLLVLHCMGYTEAMRRRVAAATARPVLLARRLVAAAVAQLL